MSQEIEKTAEAVGKLAELGIKTLDSTDKASGFLAQVFQEPIKEIAGILTDKLRFVRWRRLIAMGDEVNSILDARGIKETRAVPPKLALPLLLDASLEDDDELQKLWNNLLANAMDPNFEQEIRYAFVEIIKSLTPLDVAILESFYSLLQKEGRLQNLAQVSDYSIKKENVITGMRISEEQYEVSVRNLMRVECLAPAIIRIGGISLGGHVPTAFKGTEQVTMTALGVYFVRACVTK